MRLTTAVTLALCALLAGVVRAETKSWGWRGDGTGLFPDANPPVTWGRTSATLKGLTTQAEKPKGGEPGKNPAVLGNIPEWLVLGPFDYDPETPRKELLAKEFVPGEAAMRPDAGEKTGGSEWRKVPSTGSLLNLNNHYKDMSAKVFYAHAWLHSKEGGRVLLRLMGPTCRFWLNGEDILSLEEKDLRPLDKEVDLQKGWNSLLVKVFATKRTDNWATTFNTPPNSAFFQVVFWGCAAEESYQSQGILWQVSLPQAGRFSCAQPLVVGNMVIVNSAPSFLIAYDKLTGKRLWIDYCGHAEFATPEERQAKPDLFRQIDPKVTRIKELASSWTGSLKDKIELHDLTERRESESPDTVVKLMFQVDKKKYAGTEDMQFAGAAGLCSSTDGKLIYTWFADGVAVCHDLDGKRKWMTLENEGRSGGTGNGYKGYYISPILTDTEFVVAMRNHIAFDRNSGKLLWKIPSKRQAWPPVNPGAPITAEGTPCVNYEYLGLYKPGVGLFPWDRNTVIGNKFYVLPVDSDAFQEFTLPQEITPKTTLTPRDIYLVRKEDQPLVTTGAWSGARVISSPLVHDGLIYTVAMGGPLRVFDQQTLQHVYSVRLDLNTITFAYPYPHGSGVCASPALGGKYIYIFGSGGHSVVIKPGRTFELVAENRIECLLPGRYRGGYAPVPSNEGAHPECTVSSPIFDGNRIYYQAEGSLYCIGSR